MRKRCKTWKIWTLDIEICYAASKRMDLRIGSCLTNALAYGSTRCRSRCGRCTSQALSNSYSSGISLNLALSKAIIRIPRSSSTLPSRRATHISGLGPARHRPVSHLTVPLPAVATMASTPSKVLSAVTFRICQALIRFTAQMLVIDSAHHSSTHHNLIVLTCLTRRLRDLLTNTTNHTPAHIRPLRETLSFDNLGALPHNLHARPPIRTVLHRTHDP